MESIECSVVVPLLNEEESLPSLIQGVREALDGIVNWELILVDDGSTDGTGELAETAASGDARIRALTLARNYGQTAAMQAGFDRARGAVVVTMDGDLQNDPGDIPALLERLQEGYDLVAGFREDRKDAVLTRKVPSWAANRIIRHLTGVPIRDNGCSLKAYRIGLVRHLNLYSDMHRFIPAVAAATAGARITQMRVRHHPRRFGTSKYGLSRAWKVILDLLVIKMLHSFRERPLLLFGAAGLASWICGSAVGVASLLIVAARPDLAATQLVVGTSVAVILLGLGGYLVLLGLLAETVMEEGRRAARRSPGPSVGGAPGTPGLSHV